MWEQVSAIEAWLVALSGLGSEGGSGDSQSAGTGFGPAMEPQAWHCFRVRPANHPLRRIFGAAGLVSAFLKPGWWRGYVMRPLPGSPPCSHPLWLFPAAPARAPLLWVLAGLGTWRPTWSFLSFMLWRRFDRTPRRPKHTWRHTAGSERSKTMSLPGRCPSISSTTARERLSTTLGGSRDCCT